MQDRDRGESRNAGRRALSASALILALTACASGEGASPVSSVPTRDGQTVVVEATSFEPADLVIDSGAVVTWQWAGGVAHDVAGSDFASAIQTDGTFSHTFSQPGVYDYWCNLHPGMKGTVTVVSS